MSIQVLDSGDQCAACKRRDVMRTATEKGVIRQCRACNCAWVVVKDAVTKDSNGEETKTEITDGDTGK